MIGAIQKILQLMVIAGLVFVVARPAVLPEPARTMAQNVHVFMVGETDTWQSFQETWQQRLEQLGAVVPWFKKAATSIPKEPPQITADGILTLFNMIVIDQPMNKFESIKENLLAEPPASTSGASLYNEQHE